MLRVARRLIPTALAVNLPEQDGGRWHESRPWRAAPSFARSSARQPVAQYDQTLWLVGVVAMVCLLAAHAGMLFMNGIWGTGQLGAERR